MKDTTFHRKIRAKASGYVLCRMNTKTTEYEFLWDSLDSVIRYRLNTQGGACMISVKSATSAILRSHRIQSKPTVYFMKRVDMMLGEHLLAEFDMLACTKGRAKYPLGQRIYKLRSKEEKIEERTEEIAAGANVGVVC